MTTYSRLTLVLGGVALPLLASLPALAQEPTTPAPQAQAPQTETQQTETARPRQPQITPADRAALLDAHIAAVHAGLQLTADQDKYWPALEKAVRDGLTKLAELRQQRRTAQPPADRIEAMSRRAEADLTRGTAMKAIADAARPLYASLSDDQKRRLPMLMRAGRGNMGFGMGQGFGAQGGRDGRHPGMMGRGQGGGWGDGMYRGDRGRGQGMDRGDRERGYGMYRGDREHGRGMGRWDDERGRGPMMRRGDRDDGPRSRWSERDRSDSGN